MAQNGVRREPKGSQMGGQGCQRDAQGGPRGCKSERWGYQGALKKRGSDKHPKRVPRQLEKSPNQQENNLFFYLVNRFISLALGHRFSTPLLLTRVFTYIASQRTLSRLRGRALFLVLHSWSFESCASQAYYGAPRDPRSSVVWFL